MKFLRILFLILVLGFSARAQVVNVAVTITNTPLNTDTLTIAGNVFTWTNGTPVGANAILITNTFGGDATNLFNVSGLVVPFSGVNLTNTASNVVTFSRVALTASSTAGWALLTFTTNSSNPNTNVVVPIDSVDSASRSPIESKLVSDINTYSTTAIDQTAAVAGQIVGLGNVQTIAGAKSMTNATNVIYGAVGNTNQFVTNFGIVTIKSGANTTNQVINGGNSALYVNGDITLAGLLNSSQGIYPNTNQSWGLYPDGGVLFGDGTNAFFDIHMPDGFMGFYDRYVISGPAVTNIDYDSVSGLYVRIFKAQSATITNLTTAGTNIQAGNIQHPRYNLTTVANGNNVINAGTNVYCKLSGPTGAFSVNSITNGADGRIVILQNSTGQTMTIANESGFDGTAANRIQTGLNADVSLTNIPSSVTLIYDSSISRWIITAQTK